MNGEQQRENALTEAVSIIKQGGLIAIKGTGGYQLVCSALASKSIARIRRFKERQLKPFAVMVPSVADVAQLCKIKFSCDVIEFSGHTKSALALAIKNSLILSEHIGDLGSQRSHDVFRRELQSFERLCGMDAQSSIVCRDAHPEYGSSFLAEELSKNTQSINHHEAHLASLTAERNIGERILVVVCDDTGLGADNTIWGDEFSLIENNECTRIGSLLPFRLPGGERAVNDTRRSALDMIYETYGDKAASGPFVLQEITDAECPLLMSALKPNINAPYTTSLGRLFDGLNALPGLCSISDYDAQAPMSMSLLPTVHAEFYRLCLESSCQESVKRPSDHSSLLRRFR